LDQAFGSQFFAGTSSARVAGRGQDPRDADEECDVTQNGAHHGSPPVGQLIESRPGELTVSSRRDGDVHTIALAGELDLATAERFEQELKRVEVTDALSIVVDLSGLAFMDSTGIRILVAADARSRADSERLALRHGPPAVQRVIELTGLTDLLPFVD